MPIAPNTILIAIASLAVVVGGVWLSLSELVLVYMNWYSGVEYEPPLTSMDRLFQWLRIAVIMVTVAVVALNYLMPTVGLLFSVMFRQAR